MTGHIGQQASIGFFFIKQNSALPRVLGGCPGRSLESGLVWSPESCRWTGSRGAGPLQPCGHQGAPSPEDAEQGSASLRVCSRVRVRGVGGAVLALPAGQLRGPGQIT